MDKTDSILKMVVENILEEEGTFFVTLDADTLNLPLDGPQRLVFGGSATPDLIITDGGIDASLSINRVHYDVHIPWGIMTAVEGAGKAFYCRRKGSGVHNESGGKGVGKKKPAHLRVVK